VLGAKQRQKVLARADGRFLAGKATKRPHDNGHLADILAAEAAHGEVQSNLHADVPRQRGVEKLARVFGYLPATQHVLEPRPPRGSAPFQMGLQSRPDPGPDAMEEHPLIGLGSPQNVTDLLGVNPFHVPKVTTAR